MEPDLDDIATAEDPHGVLASIRRQGPVVRLPSGFWAVTGHDAAVEAMRSAAFASSPIGALYRERLPEGAARDEMANRINFLDPPDHPRVRRLVAKAFTPRRVEQLSPWIRSTATALADGLADRSSFDLVADLAHELPSLVISELLGVPSEDRAALTALADAVTPLLSPTTNGDEIAAAVGAAEHMHARLGELVEDRRRSGGDDLLAALVAAEEDGERLSNAELLSLAATLYSAGHRTTRDAFVNGMVRLLGDGGALWQRVVRGDWHLGAVARELLRLDTPTLYVARITATEVELGGAQLGVGEPVLVFLAAANRDPAAHADPDRFDPDREGPAHLSFAHGAHYCLGASLATGEIEVLLGTARDRWPGLHLVGGPPVWHQRGPFRGVERLDVAP